MIRMSSLNLVMPLIDCTVYFFVQLEIIIFVWICHHCFWRAAKLDLMVGNDDPGGGCMWGLYHVLDFVVLSNCPGVGSKTLKYQNINISSKNSIWDKITFWPFHNQIIEKVGREVGVGWELRRMAIHL